MGPEIYLLSSLYICLMLMFASVILYTQRERWTPQRVLMILRFPIAVGFLGVVLSAILFFMDRDRRFHSAFPGWLLLELAAVFLTLDIKRGMKSTPQEGSHPSE